MSKPFQNNMGYTQFWRVVLLLGLLCKRACSISCLQCWSLVDSACESGDMEPKQCPRPTDKHCITYVGQTKPGVMVFRDCNPYAIEQVCSIKKIERHSVRVCHGTCDTDGCNGGSVVSHAGSMHHTYITAIGWIIWILQYCELS